MSYWLLWIEILLASLLWVAMWMPGAVRVQRRWLFIRPIFIVIMVPGVILGLLAMYTALLKYVSNIDSDWFGYAISLWIAFAIGAVVMAIYGARARGGMPALAVEWKRAPLAGACLVAMAAAGMTLWNIDVAVLARADNVALEAQTLYIAEMPAITSDAENAAPLYEKAFDLLRGDHPDDLQSWPPGHGNTFIPDEPAMKAYLARQSKTIALLRRAAMLPSCRFEQDLQSVFLDPLLAQLNVERAAAGVLGLDACNEASSGRVAAALQDVMDMKRMSRQFGQRPMMISGLVAIGIDDLAGRTLQYVLPFVTRPQELADVNFDDISAMRLAMRRAWQGEEYYGLSNIRAMAGGTMTLMPSTSQEKTPAMSEIMPFPLRDFMLPDEIDAYLDLLYRVQQMTLEPYFKAESGLSELKESAIPGRPHKGLLVYLLNSAFLHSLATIATAEALDSCDQTALAMTRYRLDHGAFPSHLADLVPAYLDAVPLDPFDGNPLRFVVKGNRWIVYSIGPDGVDNGGVETDKVTHKGDVIFTLTVGKPAAATQP
ncbi:MAG: hypothetical protein ABSH22_05225 [Tepidisphaeraceae bacterium]